MTAFASRRARPHFLRRLARLAVPLVLLAGNFAPHAAAAPATAAAPACFEVWWRTRLAAAGRAADSAERAPDALFAARLVNDLARTAADLDPVLAEMDRLRATVAPHDALVAAEIDAVLLQGDLAAGRRDAAAVRAARLGLVSGWRLAGPFAAGDEPAADDTRLRDAAGPAWRHFAAGPDGAVPLALLMDPAEKTTAFASFYLRAAGPVELAIRFGADDRAELSIDGSAVLRPEGRHDLAFDQHAAFVRLAAGWHRATFRVEQETGAWGLVARVTAPDGGPLPAGVTIALPDDLAAAEREIAARSAAPRLASGRTLPATLEARARRGGPALAQQALDLFQRHLPDRQSDRALTLARQAAATSPGEVETLLVLHDVERDPARQREALDRALAIDPSHPSVLRQLAQYYLGFGQDDVSRATAERSLAACGWPDPYLLGWVTVAENARGFPGGALADLERLTQQFPAQQVLLDRQGSLARRTGRPESARRAWQQYLALQPSHDDVRMALIQLELESGRAARALELTDAAIALDPVGVPWYAQRARLLLADGRPEAALEATARGLAVGPTDPELLILKGESLLALGDGPGAAAAWQAASRALDQDLGLAERIAAVTGVDESFGSEWTQTLEQAQALERERPVAGDPALVVLASTSAYRVREDGQSIRFHQEILRVRHPEQAQSARQHQFAYSPMLQRATVLEARLVRRDGSVLVASRSEQPLLPDPETRMWYDTRVITLSLPRLEEGDLIEFRYRIADRGTANPIGAGYFGEIEFLGQSVPVLASRLVLDTAPSLPVRHRLLHLPAEPRVATETRDGRELTVIDLPPLPAYLSLAASPPPVTRVPYAVLGTAADWDALGRMYARLIEKQAVPDADVRAAAAQATAGARSRRAKIDAIYAWVIENTRYVALEFGIHALKPYDVPSVFRRRFGDCKDKATLMVAMLREGDRLRAGGRPVPRRHGAAPRAGRDAADGPGRAGADRRRSRRRERPAGDDPPGAGHERGNGLHPDDHGLRIGVGFGPGPGLGPRRERRRGAHLPALRRRPRRDPLLAAAPDLPRDLGHRRDLRGAGPVREPRDLRVRSPRRPLRAARGERAARAALVLPDRPARRAGFGRARGPVAVAAAVPDVERHDLRTPRRLRAAGRAARRADRLGVGHGLAGVRPGARRAAHPRAAGMARRRSPGRGADQFLQLRRAGAATAFTARRAGGGAVTARAIVPLLVAVLLGLGAAPAKPGAAPARPAPSRPAAPDGWALLLAGQDAAAEDAFASRLAADPAQLESAIGLAALLEGRGDPGGAMAVLERALARAPLAPLAPGAFARLMGLGSRAPDGGAGAIPLLSGVVSGEVPVADPEIRSLAVLALADVLARGGEVVPGQEVLQGYGGRLARWTLLGPYGKFERLDLYREFPPDAGATDPANAPPGVDGRPPIRVDATFPDGRVIVPDSFGEDGVVFALADVQFDRPATLRLRVLAPGSVAVAVDGRRALVADRVRERQPIALAARVAFPAGRHRIAVKVALDASASFALSLEPLDSVAARPAQAPWRVVPVEGQPAGGVRIEPLVVAPDALPADLATLRPPELLAGAWWMRARRLERSAGALLESASVRWPEARLFTVLLADHLRAAETGADPAKDLARSRALLEKAVSGDGSRWIAARVWLARHDEDANRLTEAWTASEAIVAEAPNDPDALFLQYRIAARRNWRAEADDRIERARAAAPGRNDLLDASIEWYRRSGAAARLVPAVEERSRRDPADEMWPELLAASGQVEAARAAWERALAARPASTSAWLGRARLESDAGQPAAALAVLDRAIAALPREAALLEERAALLAQLGREAEATAALQDLLDLQPGRLEVREALRQRGVTDPLSPWLIDAREVIRTAEKPGPGVDAALLGDLASVLIDREGGQTELYQGIHGIYTRAGVEREGELEVLPGAWIQGLREHKPDGRVVDVDPGTKRPISLPGLEPGDFVEYAWRRYTPPSGLIPGSLDSRSVFVFQGQDRDFVLSRYVVMHDPALPVQICGQQEGLATTDEVRDGLRVRTWTAREVPQSRTRAR